MNLKELLDGEMKDHQHLMNMIREEHMGWVEETGDLLYRTLCDGKKILVAGNGGSAADSQHFAAELICRFTTERKSLPAIALTTDSSALTAISNDYGFARVFSRQIEGLGREGDLFLAISTSGNSENLVQAMKQAQKTGMITLALLGKDGGKMNQYATHALVVPSYTTQRIQEAHEWILHTWCAMLDYLVEME
jgi:D-sedoheptulose 7-phosphate isomerase